MDLIPVASEAAKRLLSWLPPFLLRRYYTADRLARLIYIDVQPRHEAIWINLAPAAEFRVAMQVINLSPFVVELDRARIELSCGSSPLVALNDERRELRPGEVAAIYFKQVIPDGHAQQIAQNIGSGGFGISGLFQFNCKVQAFPRQVPHLSGIAISTANARLRQ